MNNKRLKKYPLLRVFFCFMVLISGNVSAEKLNVAVASNFSLAFKKLSTDFEVLTGHQLVISSASTGKLFAQIQHGAPFDVFLAADERRADLLLKANKAEKSSAYIYAKGQLVLLSNIRAGDDCLAVLSSDKLKRLSIANPKTAPYGLAAKQVMENLSLWSQLKSRLVMGENIAQAFQFVYTKNAQAGFVASSMLQRDKKIEAGCVWTVPGDMYSAINQKMVILNKAKDKLAARAFSKYMQSSRAKEIIKSAGYDVLL
jgi:molybdate transport system substrate-binding protein